MKKYFTTAILVLIVAVFTTCKKEPDAPIGGNKIEMGQTEIDTVSYFEAQVSSALANTGGNEISQHGHCWSTKSKPTTDDAKTTLGKLNAPESYTSQLTGLEDNSVYYIRSYVTYPQGTVYGTEENIKTLKTGKPVVNTTEVSNVTLYSAQCSGDVLADSGMFVTTKGICWDTTNSFTITNCLDTTIVGSDTGSFISNITALNEGVKYFVKAYANNEKGTSYGEIIQFTTVPITLPEVNTRYITDISINSATSGGNVISNGNATVSARGVCWNTSGNPTLQNSLEHTTDGSGIGSFTSEITGLNDGVTYFVSAYATNEKGTSYGEVKQFTTLLISLPEVTTDDITDITKNSATSGGDVLSNGNSSVTERGVCWNTSPNPTINNSHTTDGSGIGPYESNSTGLEENTAYYARAYATNSEGTNYGNEISFETLDSSSPCEGITSFNYGGQTYNTVEIGDQCWMKENLNIGVQINGNEEMEDNQIIEKYCYNDDESNCDTYGGLYQWDEIMRYSTVVGAKGICPEGWHIPTDVEWKQISMYLGMTQEDADGTGWRGSPVGTKLKTTYGWINNGGGTNSSGFSGLPGGAIMDSPWGGIILEIGYWWSSTEHYEDEAWFRCLGENDTRVRRDQRDKFEGYSLRCVKD